MRQRWSRLVLAGALAWATQSGAQGRDTTDLTTGLAFDIPLSMIAEAPSDPSTLYLATATGLIYVSRDAGQSWEPLSVLVRRGRFFGSLRDGGDEEETPATIGRGLSLVPHFGHMALGITPDVTADRASQVVAEPDRWVRRKIDRLIDRPEDAVGADAIGGGPDLGVGLRDGAPRLAFQVRRLKGWGVGINIKQTLATQGFDGTWINWIDVDPRDPNTLLAATDDGLRLSRDGGYSWPVVVSGVNRDTRTALVVRRSPHDPDHLLLGTREGLHVSRDGGESFERFIHPFVTTANVRWIEYHPKQRGTWLVGLSWALLRTTDDGANFDIIHISPWPDLSFVRYAVYDPHDPRRILVGTRDGLLVSVDGGRAFERAGGVQFVGQDIISLAAGPRPGHFIAATARDLWETHDGGDTWQVAYFGGVEWKNMYATYSGHRRDALWVITEAEVLRLEDQAPRQVPRALVARFRALVAREPPLDEAVGVALRRSGARVDDVVALRKRARLAGLLPTVEAGYYRFALSAFDIRTRAVLDGDDFVNIQADGLNTRPFWYVMGGWDLAALVHSGAESPISRVGFANRDLEWRVRSTVINLYQERRRLQLEALIAEREPARAGLLRDLRLEELTAHLNALTGALFEPFSAL